jgi:hypothetical protein
LAVSRKARLEKLLTLCSSSSPPPHEVVGRLGQLDQPIGPRLADLLLPQPLQKAGTTGLAAALLAVTHSPQDPPAPDLGLQVEAVAELPGLPEAGMKLEAADLVLLRIGQIQVQQRRFRGDDGDHGGGEGHDES